MGVESKANQVPDASLPPSRIFSNGGVSLTPEGSSFQAVFIAHTDLNTPKSKEDELSPVRRKEIEEDMARRCRALGITEDQIPQYKMVYWQMVAEIHRKIDREYSQTKKDDSSLDLV